MMSRIKHSKLYFGSHIVTGNLRRQDSTLHSLMAAFLNLLGGLGPMD